MIAIDTGVWIEYINTGGTLHNEAKIVIDSVIIKTKYNIAFSDCFLLALSKKLDAIVLFKSVESEMKQNIKELKRNFNLKFLEDYS